MSLFGPRSRGIGNLPADGSPSGQLLPGDASAPGTNNGTPGITFTVGHPSRSRSDTPLGTMPRAVRVAALLCTVPGAAQPGGGAAVIADDSIRAPLPRLLSTERPIRWEQRAVVRRATLTPGSESELAATSSRERVQKLIDRCHHALTADRYSAAACLLTEAVSVICETPTAFPLEDVAAVRAMGVTLGAAISERLRIYRANQMLADCMQLVTGVMEKFAERCGQTRM